MSASWATRLPYMHRVTHDLPCPICGREKWCLIAPLADFSVCTKTESHEYREEFEGWVHFIPASKRPLPASVRQLTMAAERTGALPDFRTLLDEHKAEFTAAARQRVAEALGIAEAALAAFPLGWSSQREALAIPGMSSPTGIVGIRYRRLNPRPGFDKWTCIKGSVAYPLLPSTPALPGRPLFVTEGPSDCLAATHLGLSACARWSKCLNGGALRVVRDHVLRCESTCLVVVGDNDESGGGEKSALEGARRVKLLAPDLRVLTLQPPVGIKDLREWAHQNPTAEEVRDAAKEVAA